MLDNAARFAGICLKSVGVPMARKKFVLFLLVALVFLVAMNVFERLPTVRIRWVRGQR